MITQDVTPITPLPSFLAPERPAAVDNLVEAELPLLTEELAEVINQINSTETNINNKESSVTNKYNEIQPHFDEIDLVAAAIASGDMPTIIDDTDISTSKTWSSEKINSTVDIHSKTEKTTLVDADEFMTADSTSSWSLKKITWASIKNALTSLFISKVTSTDNAVVRFDGTTGQVQNSGVVIDDNGNVGIGTNNPLGKLTISNGSEENVEFFTGSAALNGGGFQYIHRGGTSTRPDLNYYLSGGGGSHKFFTNDIERMRIDNNGNVGIGVVPSTSWFSGAKTLQFGASGSLTNNNTNNTILVHNAIVGDSSSLYQISGQQASKYQQTNGVHSWSTAPSGTAGNSITWTNAMTLDATSRLSITNGLVSGWNGSSFSATTTGIEDYKVSGSNVTGIYGRTTADTSLVFQAVVAGVTKSAILANGNFQSATNSYGSTSDAKLKENVVETSDKLDKLMNVRVVNFNYIGDDQKQIGVIAQEVEKIFPGIVYETKDTEQVEVTKTKEVTDEEGNVTTEEYTETETVETGEVTKNVKYSVIYMMMLKGMQEQQAIINDLKARIEILEAK